MYAYIKTDLIFIQHSANINFEAHFKKMTDNGVDANSSWYI